MTLGKSLGPMKISARIATTASSEESTPNIARTPCGRGSTRFVVSRRRGGYGIDGTRRDVDRLGRPDLVARQLARRLSAALLVITAALVVILVGHALLEALEALCNIAHHRREAVPTEQQQE